MTLTEATTRTIEAPGATLTYDVRPGGSAETPPLFLIGSPMGAGGRSDDRVDAGAAR